MHLHEIIWKDQFIDKIEHKHQVTAAEVEQVTLCATPILVSELESGMDSVRFGGWSPEFIPWGLVVGVRNSFRGFGSWSPEFIPWVWWTTTE